MNDHDYKFWIVWNPMGRNPQYRHATHAGAANEANRLALANPGEVFYVMEANHKVVNRGLQITVFVDDGPC